MLQQLLTRLSVHSKARRHRLRLDEIEPLEDRTLLAATFPEFVDPNPNPGNGFGSVVRPLSTGNVVVTAPYDDAGGQDAGAVYLFNGATGSLISTLIGSSAGDNVGLGVVELSNGNFVVTSTRWDNPTTNATDAGAITFGSGVTGVSGTVSASNSLVGSSDNDTIGSSGLSQLSNGSYLVHSMAWDNTSTNAVDAGAITFGNGSTGVTGMVSASNSLVGTSENDHVGGGSLFLLSNGNYVVTSSDWDNAGLNAVDAGAVTFGNATTGVVGEISSSNSLVGTSNGDQLGNRGVTDLGNGYYVIGSYLWDNDVTGASDAGAVTFADGTTAITGVISASNSLIGTSSGDMVGRGGVVALENSNYVVASPFWQNTATGALAAGAVTFGSGTTGAVGVVSSSNSLVGTSQNDQIGRNGVVPLVTGNYVVKSPWWDNTTSNSIDAGAATFGNGMTGVFGAVSSSNSLIGTTANDSVGADVTQLSNGNYLVRSQDWDNTSANAVDAGAVTWGDGTTGVIGPVTSSNSLVGDKDDDLVGSAGIKVLSNGNYVVLSRDWNSPANNAIRVGAATFGVGTVGITGVVASSNSLVGTSALDQIGSGGVIELTNGNYVVRSSVWDNTTTGAVNAGAVTFGSGTNGVSGIVSSSNSLVGTSNNDLIGSVSALSNGNYVVFSSFWTNTATGATNAGAVTFANGTTGIVGEVTTNNSLVGTSTDDQVGRQGVFPLMNGNFVVISAWWNNTALSAISAGAVTFGNGNSGIIGSVSVANSLVGSSNFDSVGSGGVDALANGNYLVRSELWNNPAINAADAGAVTFGDGMNGVTGTINGFNSLIGLAANTNLQGVYVDDLNDQFYARFLDEDNGKVRVGSTLSNDVIPTYSADLIGRIGGNWWLARSDGSSTLTNEFWGTWDPNAGWTDIQVADVDGDNDSDVVGRTSSGQWWVARNTGSSFTMEYWGAWSDLGWQDVLVADIDNDGDDDIVGRSSTGQWWVARSNGTDSFINELWGGWVESAGWSNVQVADLNGDGNADIIGQANNGQWWAAQSNGSSFSTEYWGYWVDLGWQDVQVGDVDNDGDSDVVGRSSTGQWWVARSDGVGSFNNQLWGGWVESAGWENVLLTDLDGDGNQDIIGKANNGQWWAARSNGSSFATEYWGFWVDLGWQDVRVIDVDADGHADVVGRASNGDLWIARSNGMDGFTNELWGNLAPGNWENVSAFSSGAPNAIANAFVPSIDDDEAAQSVFE